MNDMPTISERISAVEAETKAIREEVQEKVNKEVVTSDGLGWLPEMREAYWYLHGSGKNYPSTWDNDSNDSNRRQTFGVWKTEEDIELHRDYLKAVSKASLFKPEVGKMVWYLCLNAVVARITWEKSNFISATQYFPTRPEAEAFAELAKRHDQMIKDRY